MSTSRRSHKHFAIMISALILAACNGNSTSTSGGTVGVTLTGQAVTSGTPSAGVHAAGRVAAAAVRPAAGPLVDGTVELYKISPDGTETAVDIGTVTTDSSGNYTIPDVPVAATGSGAGDDFYYEVRVSDGAGTDMRAPVAPSADTAVDVSPATNLAAHILADVAKVPGKTDLPTPSAQLIESMRMLVSEDAGKLETDGSIAIPDALAASETNVIASANGLASAGGDAEKLYKAVQFESELLALATDNTVTDTDAGAYIKRVTREGNDQNSTGNALPAIAAEAMGQAMIDSTSFTPTEIVAAYNANNGPDPDVVLADKVTQFADMLVSVEDKFDGAVGAPEDMGSDSQVALYTKRDLSGTTFDATTALAPDQAVAFLQTLPKDDANPNSEVGGFSNNVDVTAIVADLTGDVTLAEPAIADVQIYHNSGFGCDQGAGFGHFMADVDVYAPGLTVTGVTVTSTDTAALGGDGTENLSQMGNRWTSNTNGACVDLGTNVTYTVTATLSNASTASVTVTRNHPLVPEATTTVEGDPASTDINTPNVLTVMRPVYTWGSPETTLLNIPAAPAGSQVKYTYEFSHVAVTGPLSGGPINSNTYPACNVVSSSGRMYSVDSFVPTVDCDVAACATATGEAESNIACRINIQTYLVDEYDRLLGQSAGNFTFFCVDTNGDSDCGI